MLKRTDFISLRKLQQIANGTALTHGLTPPLSCVIARMYFESRKNRLPIITRCGAGMLWVDKYYVAYQLGSGDVEYTYLSPRHISEEVVSYRASHTPLPKDILRCFRIAKYDMRVSNTPYWIAPEWRDDPKNIISDLGKSEQK